MRYTPYEKKSVWRSRLEEPRVANWVVVVVLGPNGPCQCVHYVLWL